MIRSITPTVGGLLAALLAAPAVACEARATSPAVVAPAAAARMPSVLALMSPAAAAHAAAQQAPPPAPRVPRARAAAPGALLETPGAPGRFTPRGWFGFAFRCAECSAVTGPSDTAAVWRFGSLPRVYSVDLGSPAARAGLQRGDVIAEIDGISILSPEGGRRFGAIRPGQTVRWTVMRDGSLRFLLARAGERPGRAGVAELNRELSRELSRLGDLSDVEALRREIADLNRRIERRRVESLRRAQREEERRSGAEELNLHRLRYAGVIGGAEVEVRGPGSVIVSEAEDKGELVITTGESVVVIRVPDEARRKRP